MTGKRENKSPHPAGWSWRRLRADEEETASVLLRRILDEATVAPQGNGRSWLVVQMTNREIDDLAAWGCQSEDVEEDDPGEDSAIGWRRK